MRNVIRTPDYPVVATKLGKLHGFVQDGVFHFHGIRYGTAERFELPEMEQPWEGIRDAKAYGYVCPLMPEGRAAQTAIIHDPNDRENPFAKPFSSFEMPHTYWPMDEQCLYLNIWTKHIDADAKRPVMVWLHGGGFGAGSSIELPSYDGHNLAEYGNVVIVSIDHRLNCIGFLNLSSFGEEFKYSGIAGMADVVLALQWVRENIAFFGGDPDNVTVAGQSGGGGKAAMLLQMPAADGLYHKVISQSGVLKTGRENSLKDEKESKQQIGRKTAELLGLTEKNIGQIRKISYEQLSEAVSKAGRELDLMPGLMMLSPSPVPGYYDGQYAITGFRKETANIPVMAGNVLGEFNFMHYLGDKTRYSEQEKRDMLKETFGDKADRITDLFNNLYPGKDILYALGIDSLFRPMTVDYLDARAAYLHKNSFETKCWNYQVSAIVPYLGGITLYHCGDIAFAFRNVEKEPVLCTATEYAQELEDRMSEAWLAFMEKGNPSTDKLSWEPYTWERKVRMQFDTVSSITGKDDTELMELARPDVGAF